MVMLGLNQCRIALHNRSGFESLAVHFAHLTVTLTAACIIGGQSWQVVPGDRAQETIWTCRDMARRGVKMRRAVSIDPIH